MPLQRGSNGLISRNLAGQLACSPLDCCETPPCPDCCVEITSGAFIDGAIKIFSFDGDNTLEITITTPSGTRYVCEDDIITIAMVYLVDGVETASPISPFVIFDPAWELTAHDPPADLTQTKPGGWVYWESEVESEFSVSLKFNGCYFNNISDLGAITIDFPGIEEVIAIERCNILSDCCRMVAECEPCCLLLDPVEGYVNPLVWSWNAELLRFERLSYAFNGDIAYWILLWIEPEPGEDVEDYAQWCLDGVWEFGISIGPANIESEVQLSGIKTAVRVEACDFDVSGDPTPDPVTVTDVTELVIEWNIEDGLGRMEYEWALIRDCAHPGCSAIDIQIELDHPTLELTMAEPLGIELFECEKIDIGGCECGCPCCGGNLPDTLTVEWTYDGVDYSFDLGVTSQDACGENNNWYLIEPTFENMFPNCGPCGKFLASFGGGCTEFDLHNLRVNHDCNLGWALYLITASGTNLSIAQSPAAPCDLPAVLSHCDIDYTISDGT